jgi:hypothetical protein
VLISIDPQFCLQTDNTFFVQNRKRDDDPSDDANIVQMCMPADGNGPYTIELRTAANSNSPYCTTIGLKLARKPPPTGCPSSSISIPPNQPFRIRSSQFGTWLLGPGGPEADQAPYTTLTPDLEAATLFTVSEASTDRIMYYATVTQRFEAYFREYYPPNSGSIDFGPLGREMPPVLFCLQPDNTFTLFSVGGDGLQTSQDPNSNPDYNVDPTVAVTCPQEEGSVYSVFIDNGIYMARNPDGPCYPDTLVYVPPVPIGCPSTTIPIPNQPFLIRSKVYDSTWLIAANNGGGLVSTTRSIDLATRFLPATDGTGRIQITSGDTYSTFSRCLTDDSGLIVMLPNDPPKPAVQFCLQSDNTFVVRSDGLDGPTANDASFALTCPSEGPVFVDNGSMLEPSCSRDTLFYERIPG